MIPGSFSQRVTIAPEVLFRSLGEEAILLSLKTELYLGLDRGGARMWTVLNDAPSVQAAYVKLLDEYDVEPEQLRQDLEEFLGKLLEQGLITISSDEILVS
jgi:hypothetical protein